MTKLLIGLAAAQAVLLLLLGFRVLAIDARTNEIASSLAATEPQSQQRITSSRVSARAATSGPSAAEIRLIIREEIAALEAGGSKQASRHSASAQPEGAANQETPSAASVDMRTLVAQAQQDLDYHIGQGKIGAADMAELQRKIVQLPPKYRKQMLSRLTRAVSTGELEGNM